MRNVSDLPSEIISLIVSNVEEKDLYACTLINKQFHVSSNPFLWRKINHRKPVIVQRIIDIVIGKIQPQLQPEQSSFGRFLRYLDLEDFRWVNETLLQVMDNAPQLEGLIMKNTSDLTDISLTPLPRKCPHLRWLYLGDAPVTDSTLCALGHYGLQLGALSLRNCTNLSTRAFRKLEPCTVLERLELGLLGVHTFDNHLSVRRTPFDLTRLLHLDALKIAHGSYSVLKRTLSSMDYGVPLPALTHLALIGIDGSADDTVLLPFLRSHPGLKSLVVSGGNALSDAILETIVEHIPGITEINLENDNHNFTRATRRYLQRTCTQLKSVTFPNYARWKIALDYGSDTTGDTEEGWLSDDEEPWTDQEE